MRRALPAAAALGAAALLSLPSVAGAASVQSTGGKLAYTAGPGDESHGLLGALRPGSGGGGGGGY